MRFPPYHFSQVKYLQHNADTTQACIICYNDFGVETPEGITETPLRLPKCGHLFGDHCIKQWFEDSDSCPYCRDKLHSEPRYRGSGARAIINMLRLRGHATPPGYGAGIAELEEDETNGRYSAGVEELYYRLLDGERLDGPARGSSERRSPPFENNGQSRRMRPRRSNPTAQEPGIPPYQIEATFNENSSRPFFSNPPSRVPIPPMQSGQGSGAESPEVGRPGAAPPISIPAGGDGSHPLSPSAPTFWPQGWAAPGEANIVANPLRSTSTSSGESGEER